MLKLSLLSIDYLFSFDGFIGFGTEADATQGDGTISDLCFKIFSLKSSGIQVGPFNFKGGNTVYFYLNKIWRGNVESCFMF